MTYSWVSATVHSQLPNNAVYAGLDQRLEQYYYYYTDKSPLYVGRAMHGCAATPAKVIPSKQACYISYDGKVFTVPNFEYLVGCGFQWVACSNGNIPEGAVVGGVDPSGEPLYFGRAIHLGSLQPGKIHKSHGCLYIAYGTDEIPFKQYDVLVQVQQKSQWVQCQSHSPVPHDAILAGRDADGSDIYVGRAQHERDMLVAKVIPCKQISYVCYDGKEIPKHNFEVLCHGNVQWVHSSNGHIVCHAVPCGRTVCGETLYIGRGQHCGSLTVGKIHPSHGCLYIPFGGSEIAIKNYEVLVEH